MTKLIHRSVATVALCVATGAFAQASNFDDYQSKTAPIAGAYGSNSGYIPEAAVNGAYDYNHNLYPYAYPRAYAPDYRTQRRLEREARLRRDRDRDGDGVANRDDRYPDNPRRW